jgi:thiamine kinase-like enzyme
MGLSVLRQHSSAPQTHLQVPTTPTVINQNDADLPSSVLALLQLLLPEAWESTTKLNVSRISGAMTNCVYIAESENTGLKVIVRVYGQTDMFCREEELMWLSRLSALHLVPKLLAIFGNGRFEEYIDSITLGKADMRDPVMSAMIAKLMKKLHSVSDIYPMGRKDDVEWWKNVEKLFPMALKVANLSADERLEEIDLKQLRNHAELYRNWLKKQKHLMVFAHNDLQYGNVLLRKSDGNVTFVDFEYSGYNPRGYDIANHFCEWMADYHCDDAHVVQPVWYPSPQEQEVFIDAYCNDKKETEQIKKEVAQLQAASDLHWGLWGLAQAGRSDIDFDYLGYGLGRLRLFYRQLRIHNLVVDHL